MFISHGRFHFEGPLVIAFCRRRLGAVDEQKTDPDIANFPICFVPRAGLGGTEDVAVARDGNYALSVSGESVFVSPEVLRFFFNFEAFGTRSPDSGFTVTPLGMASLTLA